MQAHIRHCRAAFGLGDIAVLGTSQSAAPLTMGTLRPVIILPEHLFREPDADAVASALGHEMAHIRRRDFLLNLIYELLYLLIAFHPAAIFIKRRLGETRELACDEMVIERLLSPAAYARALVALAAALTTAGAIGPRLGYTLGIFDTNNLEERVTKLMQRNSHPGTRPTKLLLVMVILIMSVSGGMAAAFSLRVQQNNASTNTAAARDFVGTWRGRWEEALRPKFIADKDSSPIWLRFTLEGDFLVGVATHDYVGLSKIPGSDVERLYVDDKRDERPLFDMRLDHPSLFFKEQMPREILEYELEMVSPYEAKLKIKNRRPSESEPSFHTWLTLTKER